MTTECKLAKQKLSEAIKSLLDARLVINNCINEDASIMFNRYTVEASEYMLLAINEVTEFLENPWGAKK
jgi:hypothetical protein